MQGGPRRGRSPITGPALPTPEAAQTTIIKSPRARRAQKSPLKGQARFHCPCRPPRRRPKQHQNKPRARRAQKITLKRQALLYCSYANPNEPFPTITVSYGTPYSQPDAFRPFIQRYTTCWHCTARREIAERSEEAPGAEAAQPSRNVGCWKAPAGCFGGDARGAEKGAQPHNRPRLAPAGGGPNNK